MRRHELTDSEGQRLEPLLPPRARTGRPPKEHGTIVNALLWLAKTAVPWRDLPERFGPWRTVATRFYRWTASGPWSRILGELHRGADARGEVDWDVHMVDATSIRAHRCAAGGKGGSRLRLSGAHVAVTAASSTFAVIGAADRSPPY
jgi:transposase